METYIVCWLLQDGVTSHYCFHNYFIHALEFAKELIEDGCNVIVFEKLQVLDDYLEKGVLK